MSVSSGAGYLTRRFVFGFGCLEQEEYAMVHIGMDGHQASTTFCVFDPAGGPDGQYRFDAVPTGAERFVRRWRRPEKCCFTTVCSAVLADHRSERLRAIPGSSRRLWLSLDLRASSAVGCNDDLF
ncbi:MAG: hypothetical protein V1790_10045 [Planctomycetota bacterium]